MMDEGLRPSNSNQELKRDIRSQLLYDYWNEIKRTDCIFSLLVSFGYLSIPDKGYKICRFVRVIHFLMTFMLVIGFAVTLGCGDNSFSASTIELETFIFATIPLEIFHFIYFVVVMQKDELHDAIKDATFCGKLKLYVRQFFGKTFGIL